MISGSRPVGRIIIRTRLKIADKDTERIRVNCVISWKTTPRMSLSNLNHFALHKTIHPSPSSRLIDFGTDGAECRKYQVNKSYAYVNKPLENYLTWRPRTHMETRRHRTRATRRWPHDARAAPGRRNCYATRACE